MKRWISTGAAALFGLALLLPAPAEAEASVRLRLGQLTLDGDSEYWDAKALDFTASVDDYEEIFAGGDFLWHVNSRMAVMTSIDHFDSDVVQEYRDFVDADGFSIEHTTTLEITPVTLGLVVELAPPGFPIRPYVGAGGGFYLWRLEEDGDFIDFTTNPPEVFGATFEDEGTPLGYYVLAGIEIPVGPYFGIVAEGRWDTADDTLEGDFAGLGDLDLSGRRVSAGISWSF